MELVRFAVAVDVMPKDGISDPQGQTVERALPTLGFADVREVRVGKRIELLLDAPDADTAAAVVRAACVRFLANPVIEEFAIHISEVGVPLGQGEVGVPLGQGEAGVPLGQGEVGVPLGQGEAGVPQGEVGVPLGDRKGPTS